MLAKAGEPLFLAAWDRAVFIHYEADPGVDVWMGRPHRIAD